jgi:hypothetical protein
MKHPLRRIRPAWSPVLLAALATPAVAQSDVVEPNAYAILPVQHLTGVHQPTPRLPFQSMVGLRRLESWPFLVHARAEPECVVEFDELFEIVHLLDRRFEEEADGARLDAREGRLHVTAPKAHLAETKALLAALDDHLVCEVQIDAVVIRHDGTLLPPTIVQPDQARGLFESHDPVWRGKAQTPAGMTSYLGRHTATRYLHTYEPQISEGRQLAVPTFDEAFDGVGMLVAPHRVISDDDLVVQVQFAIGRLDTLVDHQTGLSLQGDLQRPLVDTTTGCMSARIPNGGALVFNATAPAELGGNVTIVVRARHEPPKAKLPADVAVLPTSALTSFGGIWPRFHDSERLVGGREDLHESYDEEPQSGRFDADELHDLLHSNVSPDSWDDTAHALFRRGRLLLIAEGETRERAISFLRMIERTSLVNAELRLDLGDGRITMPTMLDRNHTVRHGRETTAVRRVNGEVAKNASILVPEVARVFDGASFAIRPYDAGQRLGAELTWLMRRSTEAPRPQSLPAQLGAGRDHQGAIPEGGLDTGAGALGAERWTLRRP